MAAIASQRNILLESSIVELVERRTTAHTIAALFEENTGLPSLKPTIESLVGRCEDSAEKKARLREIASSAMELFDRWRTAMRHPPPIDWERGLYEQMRSALHASESEQDQVASLLHALNLGFEHSIDESVALSQENREVLFFEAVRMRRRYALGALFTSMPRLADRAIAEAVQETARKNDTAMLRVLLNESSRRNMKGGVVSGALISAAKHNAPESMQLIFNKVAAGTVPEISIYRSGEALSEAARHNHYQCLTMLLDPNRWGRVSQEGIGQALIASASCGYLSCLEEVLKQPIKEDFFDYALEWAITNNQIPALQRLIESELANEATDRIFGKALCTAVKTQSLGSIKYLFESGRVPTSFVHRALLESIKLDHFLCFHQLLRFIKPKPLPLRLVQKALPLAAFSSHAYYSALMLRKPETQKVSPDAVAIAIIEAARSGSQRYMQWLTKLYPRNAIVIDRWREATHVAVEQGFPEALEQLLELVGDIFPISDIATFCHEATKQGHGECLRLLLQTRQFAEIPPRLLSKLSHTACSGKHMECFYLLNDARKRR